MFGLKKCPINLIEMISEVQKLELIQMILTLQDEQVLVNVKTMLKKASMGSPKSDLKRQAPNTCRPFGFAKGMISYVSPDFDETPTGFEAYSPNTNA